MSYIDDYGEPEDEYLENNRPVYFTVHIIKETEKAIMFFIADLDPVWLPKSQICMSRQEDGRIVIEMPCWLFWEKGLDGEVIEI